MSEKREILINLRKEKGLTQNKVAQDIGINRSYYGFLENGKRNPSLKIAMSIADYFNISLQEAFPNEVFFANKCYEK